MVKELDDYRNTRTYIVCESFKEYLQLIPLLNKIYRGWDANAWTDDRINYINMRSDCMDTDVEFDESWKYIEAAEFLESQDRIVNNYSIF